MAIWDEYIRPSLVVAGVAGSLYGAGWLGANYTVSSRGQAPVSAPSPSPLPDGSVARVRITSGTPEVYGQYSQIMQVINSPNTKQAYNSGQGSVYFDGQLPPSVNPTLTHVDLNGNVRVDVGAGPLTIGGQPTASLPNPTPAPSPSHPASNTGPATPTSNTTSNTNNTTPNSNTTTAGKKK